MARFITYQLILRLLIALRLRTQVLLHLLVLMVKWLFHHCLVCPTRDFIFESGIDDSNEEANSINRQSLITSLGLLDTAFAIAVDTRFISTVFQLRGNQNFNGGQNSDKVTIPTEMVQAAAPTATQNLTNYSTYTIRGVDNLLFAPTGGTRSDPSALAGPRGTGLAMMFAVRSEMRKTSGNSTPTCLRSMARQHKQCLAAQINTIILILYAILQDCHQLRQHKYLLELLDIVGANGDK